MTTTERPILFSAPMVRAILDRRKTMTRRAVKPREPRGTSWQMTYLGDGRVWPHVYARPTLTRLEPAPCPYGQPGDRLWVRETWAPREDVDPRTDLEKARHYTRYRADGGDLADEWHCYRRWRSSIHMPRWASRLTLEVTDVRVERLQDISEADARAEGVDPMIVLPGDQVSYVAAFGDLWAGINGAESWDANPWVWVVGFKRIETEAAR
jgi:hypothetical protein